MQASQDLYDLLVSKNFNVKTLDNKGNAVVDPGNADLFSFDFEVGGTNYGQVDCLINDNQALQMYFGDHVGKTMETGHKKVWFEFLEQMKRFAMRNLFQFDLKNSARLRPALRTMAAANESVYKKICDHLFEGWNGTKMTSYNNKRSNVRLKIVHNKPMEETDQRWRAVKNMFIETPEGERFKLPFKSTSAGKAMTRHVIEGGTPYDAFGLHIVDVVRETNALARFLRGKTRQVTEDHEDYELVQELKDRYKTLRKRMKQITGKRGYHAYKESWDPAQIEEGIVAKLAARLGKHTKSTDLKESEYDFNEGDQVVLVPPYAEDESEVFTLTQWDEMRGRGFIADEDGRGWYVDAKQIAHAPEDDDLDENSIAQQINFGGMNDKESWWDKAKAVFTPDDDKNNEPEDKELDEAHGNSKVYDKCWKGYKKVPGKKRGEKGSCVKEDELEEAKDPKILAMKLHRMLKKYDAEADTQYDMYGQPDYLATIKLAMAGKIDQAAGEFVSNYTDQDGGEAAGADDMYEELKYEIKQIMGNNVQANEGFRNEIEGGKVPVGNYTFVYTMDNPADLDFVIRSAEERGMAVLAKGKTKARIDGNAGQHTSLVRSLQDLSIRTRDYNGSVTEPHRAGELQMEAEANPTQIDAAISEIMQLISEYEDSHLDRASDIEDAQTVISRLKAYNMGEGNLEDIVEFVRRLDTEPRDTMFDIIQDVFGTSGRTMSPTPKEIFGLEESVPPGSYMIWTVEFADGNTKQYKGNDEAKRSLEKKHPEAVKISTDWVVRSDDELYDHAQANTMKELNEFENWADEVTEATWGKPDTKEKLNTLRDFMTQEQPAGPDLINVQDILYDILGNDDFQDALTDFYAENGADADVRIVVKSWLEANMPEIAAKVLPLEEAKKPDYIDLDDDGDTEESMKKAAKDKAMKEEHDLDTSEEVKKQQRDPMLEAADWARLAGLSQKVYEPVAEAEEDEFVTKNGVNYKNGEAIGPVSGDPQPPQPYSPPTKDGVSPPTRRVGETSMQHGMNDIGIAAAQDENGKFHAFLHDKHVGGPFDSDEDLKKFQTDYVNNPDFDFKSKAQALEAAINEEWEDEGLDDRSAAQQLDKMLASGKSLLDAAQELASYYGVEPYEVVQAGEHYGSMETKKLLAGFRKLLGTDLDEGNAFSGALANAKRDGKSEFEVDGKTYKVNEAGGAILDIDATADVIKRLLGMATASDEDKEDNDKEEKVDESGNAAGLVAILQALKNAKERKEREQIKKPEGDMIAKESDAGKFGQADFDERETNTIIPGVGTQAHQDAGQLKGMAGAQDKELDESSPELDIAQLMRLAGK